MTIIIKDLRSISTQYPKGVGAAFAGIRAGNRTKTACGLLPYLQQAKQRMHDLMANGATSRRSAAEEMEEDRKGGREEDDQNLTG